MHRRGSGNWRGLRSAWLASWLIAAGALPALPGIAAAQCGRHHAAAPPHHAGAADASPRSESEAPPPAAEQRCCTESSPAPSAWGGAGDSPYAGLESRPVKALSAERRDGLLAGAGLGYAMAAELNGHPGPKHVLDLADELALSDAQRAGVQASFDRMHAESMRLGAALVAAEEQLDRRFAHRHLDAAALAELTAGIARLEGELRYTHLVAHLETDALLTAEQRARYAELRGYGPPGAARPAGGEHVH